MNPVYARAMKEVIVIDGVEYTGLKKAGSEVNGGFDIVNWGFQQRFPCSYLDTLGGAIKKE